jgi:t-SNARE complex subunit (syntaxin)
VSAARAAQDDGDGGYADTPAQSLEQQQQQEMARLALQDEVDFREALIIEREEEIRNIEQGVGDLNVLFTQVAAMVHEQGEQLDTIEHNVENVRVDTRGADIELRSAARYQKAARSKACCLLLILAIILTIVLLAIFLG